MQGEVVNNHIMQVNQMKLEASRSYSSGTKKHPAPPKQVKDVCSQNRAKYTLGKPTLQMEHPPFLC